MTEVLTIRAVRAPAAKHARRRTAARRARPDSESLLVVILTMAATGVACYDLLLLALAAR